MHKFLNRRGVWPGILVASLAAFSVFLGGAGPVAADPDVNPLVGCNEPVAAVVSPLNPRTAAVAACNRVGVSTDFGRTWTLGFNITTTLPAGLTAGTWTSCGDPSLAYDAAGRLFWTYLLCGDYDPDGGGPAVPDGNRDEITVASAQINPTTGALIGTPVDISPGQFNDDKEWLAADADPGSPFANNLYVVWTRLGGGSQVMFSRSTNSGATWSAPQTISGTAPTPGGGENFVWPSHLAVAPNGDLYVAYHSNTCPTLSNNGNAAGGEIAVIRSSNGGADLSSNPPTVGQKTFAFPSGTANVTCNLQGVAGAIPLNHHWMQGSAAPYVLTDPLRPGNVYVVANDDPNNDYTTGDPGDVMLARSTDYGETWARSTISHAPENTLQAYPTGAIDQDGRIAVMWWDNRRGLINPGPDGIAGGTNAADDYNNLDMFASVSQDGGATFSNDFRIQDTPLDPDAGAACRVGPTGCAATANSANTLRIGEYNGIAAANGNAYAAFTGNTFTGAPPVANGQLMLFDVFSIAGLVPDRFEPNDAIDPGIATDLGAHGSYSQDGLTIHGLLDEDFFRVTARDSGTLAFRIGLTGRASDLDLQVQDKFGNVVGTSLAGQDQRDNETVTIPAVAGEPYYVRVFAEPNQVPPFNVYDLAITNTAAPAPFQLTLAPGSDSGRSTSDNVTNDSTPTVRFQVDQGPLAGLSFSPGAAPASDTPGYKVAVFRNGNLAGYATPVPGDPGSYDFTFGSAIADGAHALTARVVIVDPSDPPTAGTSHVVGQGSASAPLQITVDTAAPATPAAPDLIASSDSGGIAIDNITTVQAPNFAGSGEGNALFRIYADGDLVGQGTSTAAGDYQIGINPLADGVYQMGARQEDLAGNVSVLSATLKVTIANQSLTLSSATGGVTTNLGNATVTGYAVPGGTVGILGIPVVNLDASGFGVTINGSAGDDVLDYKPTGTNAASVKNQANGQLVNFSGAVGSFALNPGAGSDLVTALGTTTAETITVLASSPTTTAKVGSLATVALPAAATERLRIGADEGADTVDVTTYEGGLANLTIDGAFPASKKHFSDTMLVRIGSAGGKLRNVKSSRVPFAGSVFATYTTTQTRIDYEEIEYVKLNPR